MAQDPAQPAIIAADHPVEECFRSAIEPPLGPVALAPQEQRAHHRRQRQRDEARHQHRGRHRHGEFAEQAADDAGHEQERDEHGDQRNRDRYDGEADLAGALDGRLERAIALFEVAHDVFDHHDRVVDHEADRDGEPHEREIVEAVAERVHHAEGCDQRQRHHDARDHGRPEIAQEQEDDHHDEADGQTPA